MPPKRASLVAAAQATGVPPPVPSRHVETPANPTSVTPVTPQPSTAAAGPSSFPMRQTGSGSTIGSGSGSAPGSRAASVVSSGLGVRITPGPSALGGMRPGGKLKFRPTIPARRSQMDSDVKPDEATLRASSSGPSSGSRARGAPRGKSVTRGGARGGSSARPAYTSVGVGVFGAGVARTGGARSSPFVPPPARRTAPTQNVEEYSDQSDRDDVIDIDAVSTLGESAPTSLFRDRHRNGVVKRERRAKKGKVAKAGSPQAGSGDMQVDDEDLGVKTEPASPQKRFIGIDGKGGAPPPIGWEEGQEDINEAQKVDLSESESDEYEEDRTGDFVQTENGEDPSNRLYVFQFPHLFPNFVPSGPVDLTDVTEDIKPDIKPTATQLRAAAPSAMGKKGKQPTKPPPEGRIGTLVCTKKGKVKMVLGDGIVMDVTAGLDTRFLQQLIHVDPTGRALTSLGEVHRLYKVTPDIDRLLRELYINGGKTPWEKEQESASAKSAGGEGRGVKTELD